MSPVTHFLTGWVLANTGGLEPRDCLLVTLSAVVPDADGLGIIPEIRTRPSRHPLLWFSRYHHALHTLPFCRSHCFDRVRACQAEVEDGTPMPSRVSPSSFEDILGSRGPDGDQWPIPYLAPFSSRLNLTWSGQWALNAWPNFVITVALLGMTLYLHGHAVIRLSNCCIQERIASL